MTPVLWSVGAPVLCDAQLASSFPLGLFLQRRSSITSSPSGMGYFNGGSPGGPWCDQGIASSTATWPRPPWGDGHVLGARCRRTSDYCVSHVLVHVGPTWVSFKGSPPQCGEGHGPPASQSTVGCKLGHDSPWDTITETSVKGSDAINPQGWEKGSLSETLIFAAPFLVGIPAVQVTIQQRMQGERTRVVRRRTERTQHAVSTRTISSRVVSLWVFVEDFAVVEEQVKVFSFLDSDERKVFRKACRF